MIDSTPLVSIGIPTYNRAHILPRTIESVLAQNYGNIEVVISDNASEDDTRAVCEEFCRRDSRVRYSRQPLNRGATANFVEVLRRSNGDLFMVLGDDDWLDCDYVDKCVQRLLEQPDLALVCGMVRVFDGQRQLSKVETAQFGLTNALQLMQQSGVERMVEYYRQTSLNYLCFGITRRDLQVKWPLKNTAGGDMTYVGSIAYLGKIQTLESTAINYSRGGISKDWRTLATGLGLPKWAVRYPRLNFLLSTIGEILWVSPVFRSGTLQQRCVIAYKIASVIYRRWVRDELVHTKPSSLVYSLYHHIRRIINKSMKTVSIR